MQDLQGRANLWSLVTGILSVMKLYLPSPIDHAFLTIKSIQHQNK